MSFRTFHVMQFEPNNPLPVAYWTGDQWYHHRQFALQIDSESKAKSMLWDIPCPKGNTVKIGQFTY